MTDEAAPRTGDPGPGADDYTGEVTPGGPMQVRELAELTIMKLAVGPYENNAYLLRCRRSGEALLIDAADEPDRLEELLQRGGPITTVLTTHQHADHWQALATVVGRTGARTMAGADDASGIPVATDRTLQHGEVVHLGAVELQVIGLRGHTPGSVAFYYRDPAGTGHLFTGDSLFPGGVGRTVTPETFSSLITDVSDRIFDVYDDDTWFYPGHGNDSTLGAERPHLQEWRERGW